MLDIINRRSLFITNITGHTSGKYSWKSYSVQSDSLAADSAPAGGELPLHLSHKPPLDSHGWGDYSFALCLRTSSTTEVSLDTGSPGPPFHLSHINRPPAVAGRGGVGAGPPAKSLPALHCRLLRGGTDRGRSAHPRLSDLGYHHIEVFYRYGRRCGE
jgi:hypothetical protein